MGWSPNLETKIVTKQNFQCQLWKYSLAVAGEAGLRGQSIMFDNAGLSRQLRPYL